MNLRHVQNEQAAYDSEHWPHEPGDDTIDHSERHITKLAGKLATVAEMHDHGSPADLTQLDSEVIPDLLIFAARLANTRGLDLAELFKARTAQLRQRFSETAE